MKAKPLPTKEELDKRYSYDPITGILVSKKTKRPIKSKQKNYYVVYVDFETYKAHRVIWRMMTGEDPGDLMIDHKDRDTLNNKWNNLKPRDNSGNNLNNGAPCYTRVNNRWRVRITYKNKLVIDKCFEEEQCAIATVRETKEQLLQLHKTQRDEC